MEKVSLYIPCYNAARTIKECIESIINQSYKIDEILIIDDASEDNTVEIAKQYPVRIITHRRNKGLAACRNTAFIEAKNDFVASLDADCVADTEWLKELMECFRDNSIAGAGGMLSERHAFKMADKWRAVHMAQHWGSELLENPPFLYGGNTVFRRKAIERVSFYNENYRTNYEDVNFSLRIYNCGLNLVYNPGAHVEHLKQDTISSVLYSYRRWFYYVHTNLNHINQFPRRLAMCLGRIGEYLDISEVFFREDLRAGVHKLLPLDFILLLYCTWLELKELLKILFLSKNRV